jgi:AhpD family alkylhydroperoxidase
MTTHAHSDRLDLFSHLPSFYQAMLALHEAAVKDLDPTVADLVQMRASQLNRCAFCLDMHSKDALQRGERPQRLYLLSAWNEVAGLYTPRERAALALTEAITLLTEGFVPDEVYQDAAKEFAETELAGLIGLVVAINAWNRISVTTRLAPPLS